MGTPALHKLFQLCIEEIGLSSRGVPPAQLWDAVSDRSDIKLKEDAALQRRVLAELTHHKDIVVSEDASSNITLRPSVALHKRALGLLSSAVHLSAQQRQVLEMVGES